MDTVERSRGEEETRRPPEGEHIISLEDEGIQDEKSEHVDWRLKRKQSVT